VLDPARIVDVGPDGGGIVVSAGVMLIVLVAELVLKLLSPAYVAFTEFVPPGS